LKSRHISAVWPDLTEIASSHSLLAMTGSGVIASPRVRASRGPRTGSAKQSRDREAPIIVVHSLDHAVGALAAAARVGRPVVLASAPDAGGYVGPGWFAALMREARETVPEARFAALLDCGDSAGAALAAVREEVEGIVFTGGGDVACRLADIAQQHGVRLETERPPAGLDLGDVLFASREEVERRCAEFLG
jgi:hypothetical protein